MTDKPDRDFFQAVIISGIRHPAMVIALIAGLISGGFVAGTGYTVMQGQLAELSRSVDLMKDEIKRVERDTLATVTARDARMERIFTDLSDVKGSIRSIETSLSFIVQQQRQQMRGSNSTIPRQ